MGKCQNILQTHDMASFKLFSREHATGPPSKCISSRHTITRHFP